MSAKPDTAAAGAASKPAGEGHEIRWRLRLASPPDRVFELLSTDYGRAAFWAEYTESRDDRLVFHFPGGEVLETRVLEVSRPHRFALTYFDGTTVRFELREARPGTELVLSETGLTAEGLRENRAGWISVLLALKAFADHGVDLRNHDPRRSWSEGYVDN